MSPMPRRSTLGRLAATAGTLALAMTLTACGNDVKTVGGDAQGANPEWKDLTFTVGEQSDGIKTLAETSGAFDDASYSIKFAKFEYGPPLVAAAGAGDVDLGMVGSVPPIAGAAKDLGFKVIATQQPFSTDVAIENIIVPQDSTATSLKDLKGKRIALPQGSSAHGLVLNALKAEGMTPKDVEIVYLDPKAGAAAFDSGKVDAWSIWNPQGQFAIDKGAKVLVPGVPPIDDTNLYYVGSDKSLDDPIRRAALTDVLTRLAEAYAYGNSNPEKHAKAVSRDSGIPLEQARSAIAGMRYRLQYVSDEKIAGGQTLADNFYEAGEIDKQIDFADVVENILPSGFNVG